MTHDPSLTAEEQRLRESQERTANWKRWGPYLSERQWGTVREDYSPNGDSWSYFPHDHARSRAYRWGEDGILGITDRECRLCFGLAMWNGQDPILKERLYGLTGPEGNHGEDVKECYYYLDSTPTHSYMKGLYKYPQREFPYEELAKENRRRGRLDPEYELLDTGIFHEERYFDVYIEYAKGSPNDVLIQITVANQGPEAATLHLLPTLWFRNTWSWGCVHEGSEAKPTIERAGPGELKTRHPTLGACRFAAAPGPDGEFPNFVFTENETNAERLFKQKGQGLQKKDAFHDYVIRGRTEQLNARPLGTKAAAHYVLNIPAQEQVTIRLRLYGEDEFPDEPLEPETYSKILSDRIEDADRFYLSRIPATLSWDERQVARQAFAGLLWSKQFYQYIVEDWMNGDPGHPTPAPQRKKGRNRDWPQLYNRDIISMPDKWEYPWYAAWDLAFHMIPFAKIDPDFAKEQLLLFLREWYMHPNGQIPAYEWNFSDVNPPVHAWACWRVYKMTGKRGSRDRKFLARCFNKLLINFTWWVNRKDIEGNHLFAGGFLGLDNIGVFDRSRPLPDGGRLEQADGTAWMAFYCNTMLAMALELAHGDQAYEDIASKFFEHFVAIADAMNTLGGTGLWDQADGFYYDRLHVNDTVIPMRLRSMVGIIPLFAVEVLEDDTLASLPGFRKRMQWFLDNRPDLARNISYLERDVTSGAAAHGHRMLAIPTREKLTRVLRYLLDTNEFLSPYGIRSLSRKYKDEPYVFRAGGEEHCVAYVPAESDTGMFGGNSNWRGPIWFPVNFLLIEALERYHHFYGDSLKVEFPTGSCIMMNLAEVATELSARMTQLFLPAGKSGLAPCHGGDTRYAEQQAWRDLAQFHEYFDGDTGRGVGANHQTGWTALVASLLYDLGCLRKE